MLFDHKPVEQITEDEFRTIIGAKEDEHTEFKGDYNKLFHSDDKVVKQEQYELLKDIASMANSGGGYIFIGVRTNNDSVAIKFDSVDSSTLAKLKQIILDLSVQHIEERIAGLEVKKRIVDGSELLVIRIPNSVRIPHMVKFSNNTHFAKRYQDGKREMTFAEIRTLFNNDFAERRLTSIEQLLKKITQKNPEVSATDFFAEHSISELSDGKDVSNEALSTFLQQNLTPAFYIGAGPRHTQSTKISLSDEKTKKFLWSESREDRYKGWNMSIVPRVSLGASNAKLIMGDREIAVISMLANGHMSFETLLNRSFCWGQSAGEFERRPRFSPYAVVEFPVSFLRMYKRMIGEFNINDSEWCLTICFRKPKGFYLAPGHPLSAFFDMSNAVTYDKDEDLIVTEIEKGEFVPDEFAYNLLSKVFAKYGLPETSIPFYSDENSTFAFQ